MSLKFPFPPRLKDSKNREFTDWEEFQLQALQGRGGGRGTPSSLSFPRKLANRPSRAPHGTLSILPDPQALGMRLTIPSSHCVPTQLLNSTGKALRGRQPHWKSASKWNPFVLSETLGWKVRSAMEVFDDVSPFLTLYPGIIKPLPVLRSGGL